MTLTTDKQILIEQRIANDAKSMPIAYLLWFFLGWLGAHRFYLDRTGTAITMLVLTVVGWLTMFFIIGIPLLMVVGIWMLVDAFLIPGIVQEQRDQMRQRLSMEASVQSVAGPETAAEIPN